MKRPQPVEGLVIKYDYLWKNESLAGRIEGQKDRPTAIVMAAPPAENGKRRIIVAPITHSEPRNVGDAIEVPPKVRKHLGLDDERQWIVVTEVNRVDWEDPGIRPAKTDEWAFGEMPQALVKQVQEAIAEHARAKRLKVVMRDAETAKATGETKSERRDR